MNEGFVNEVNGEFVATDQRFPMLRFDVCFGGEKGTGLDLVVLNKKFIDNAGLRKLVIDDIRKLLIEVENYKEPQE